MPATDPLAPATPAAPAAVTPAPAPADVPMTHGDAERLLSALETGWGKVIKAVSQPQQAVTPTPARPANDDDALTAIASDGWKPLDSRVEAAVGRVLKEQLGPYLGAQATDAAVGHEAAVRDSIDREFGAGTYDAEFKDRVSELFGDNTPSRAIRAQWDRAVQLVKGQQFEALADKRTKAAAARAAAAEEEKRVARAAYMPGRGSYFTPEAENTLSDDEREQLKKAREVTGHAASEEDSAKMRNLMMSKRDGVTLDDFNKAFPLKQQ